MVNYTLMDSIWQGFSFNFPIYPWFNETTRQVYNKNIFREMVITETTWGQLDEMLEDFKNLRNKYIGYNLGNSSNYLVRENKRFIFSNHGGLFSLWDDFDQSLGHFSLGKNYKNEVPSEEFIKWIEKVTKEYCEGVVHCSDCGREIKKSEIAGRYFAGIYCKDCWKSKWRETEAKETYN